MKRGFTLLELIIVIIIIGVLATLGFAQYGRMVEKSRGAEARAVLGAVRTAAAAFRLENANDTSTFTNAAAGIGTSDDQIPSACRVTNYFKYAVVGAADGITATATRCVGAIGKQPGASKAYELTLTTDFVLGTDIWTSTGGY